MATTDLSLDLQRLVERKPEWLKTYYFPSQYRDSLSVSQDPPRREVQFDLSADKQRALCQLDEFERHLQLVEISLALEGNRPIRWGEEGRRCWVVEDWQRESTWLLLLFSWVASLFFSGDAGAFYYRECAEALMAEEQYGAYDWQSLVNGCLSAWSTAWQSLPALF